MGATVATLLLAALSLLLLAAHFFRAGLAPLTVLCVAGIGLLFVRRPLAARVLQAMLALGALEWLRTAWSLAAMRHDAGEPYARLLVILGSVAGIALVTALLLRSQPARRHFGSHRQARAATAPP